MHKMQEQTICNLGKSKKATKNSTVLEKTQKNNQKTCMAWEPQGVEAICIELPLELADVTMLLETCNLFMRGTNSVPSTLVSFAMCASHVARNVAPAALARAKEAGIEAEHGDLVAELGHKLP